jgi:hypothetical protein
MSMFQQQPSESSAPLKDSRREIPRYSPTGREDADEEEDDGEGLLAAV